eukprot:IDg9171t1
MLADLVNSSEVVLVRVQHLERVAFPFKVPLQWVRLLFFNGRFIRALSGSEYFQYLLLVRQYAFGDVAVISFSSND